MKIIHVNKEVHTRLHELKRKVKAKTVNNLIDELLNQYEVDENELDRLTISKENTAE